MDGADFAKGSRFMRRRRLADITPVRAVGNWGLNAIVNVLFRTRYTDLCYGYNAFWADMIPLLDLPDHAHLPAPQRQDAVGRRLRDRDLINCRFAAGRRGIAEVPSVELLRIHGE